MNKITKYRVEKANRMLDELELLYANIDSLEKCEDLSITVSPKWGGVTFSTKETDIFSDLLVKHRDKIVNMLLSSAKKEVQRRENKLSEFIEFK